MLRISDLCTSAGSFTVDEVTLSVPDGCCHALLGGTGNGKTLILETVAGLRPITKGEIWAGERNITMEPPERRFISYVPQDLALFPHLNVEENIFYSRRFKKNRCRGDREVLEIVERMQLGDLLKRSIANLSGGERQRVALVRAFASGNKIMLLDEPFSAVHYAMRRSLWGMLTDMQHSYGLSILIVTHSLEEAQYLADDISVVSGGRILQTGAKHEVFNRPSNLEASRITGHYNYSSGRVSEVADDHIFIDCAKWATRLRARNPGCAQDDDVVVAVRTSDIEILDSAVGASSPGNTVCGTIGHVFGSHHHRQIGLWCGDQGGGLEDDLLIDVYRERDRVRYEIGQELTLSIPEDRIHVFRGNAC